ncbi:hypothetical protein CHARACLAT_015051 [Characodon lateralis]|uniref:Uncharacterized protein n=1 Tax=Characodon lateralis TaxID=208331 RepID=A0ABU7CRT7_9TELE|nr:hypothetical protein [Characodon lateralis]
MPKQNVNVPTTCHVPMSINYSLTMTPHAVHKSIYCLLRYPTLEGDSQVIEVPSPPKAHLMTTVADAHDSALLDVSNIVGRHHSCSTRIDVHQRAALSPTRSSSSANAPWPMQEDVRTCWCGQVPLQGI